MGDYIKVDLQEVGWGMDCINVAKVRGRWWAAMEAVVKLHVL